MVQAQEYLNQHYPKDQRKEIKVLDLTNQNLAGVVDCSDFINLEMLWCNNNQLTELILLSLPNLTDLNCANNYLINLDFLSQLNPEQLEELRISNNNFPVSDLTIFGSFTNLRVLDIGNEEKEKIKQGIYNRFRGSLAPCQSLRKLKVLDIRNTDLNSGLEYLPDSLTRFYCFADYRPAALVSSLVQKLEVAGQLNGYDYISLLENWRVKNWRDWKKQGFSEQERKQWMSTGLLISEYDFATHLKEQGFVPGAINCQDWLNFYYPTEKRKEITELDLSERKFVGKLDCADFTNLKSLNINNTNITADLEFLPDSLETLNCQGTKLEAELEPYKGDNIEKLQLWKKDYLIKILQEENSKIKSLEDEVLRLATLIKDRKERVVKAYLHSFAESQKELLHQLINAHLKYNKAKKQNLPSVKLKKDKERTYNELEEKIGEEQMEKVEKVLTDCEDLIHWDIELDEKIIKRDEVIDQSQQKIQTIVNNFNVSGGYLITGNTFGDNANFSYLNKYLTIEDKQIIRREIVEEVKKELFLEYQIEQSPQ